MWGRYGYDVYRGVAGCLTLKEPAMSKAADVMFPALALPPWMVTLVAGVLIVGYRAAHRRLRALPRFQAYVRRLQAR